MQYDIVIAGGGMVGATLAVALAQQTSLSILVLEANAVSPHWDDTHYSPRVSAISLASQRIFAALNVWESILQKRVGPFVQIEVWETDARNTIQFHAHEIAEARLGYIIENTVIQSALHEKIKQYPQIKFVAGVQLQTFHETEKGVELHTVDGQSFKASLAIAADGANSWLRKQAGITLAAQDYAEEAIVATVQTELAHQQVARQVFLKSGPLAFLPLADTHFSSIVWTLPQADAKKHCALDDAEFKLQLGHAFSHRLGNIVEIDKRYTFPLRKQKTLQYVKSRLALVGDAAHSIHPLAGQGVNMGLLDAASLTEIIADACKKRRDFSHLQTLRVYERWRKADNLTLLQGIDVIKTLFQTDKQSLATLRYAGLQLTKNVSWIKNIFTQHAVGNRDNLPALAK